MLLRLYYRRISVFIKKIITLFGDRTWIKWKKFPKDDNPLTLSIYELLFLIIILILAGKTFEAFNNIPHHIISIQADKINNYRYIKIRPNTDDSICYIYYQNAELSLNIPMSFEKSPTNASKNISLSGYIREDSMMFSTSRVLYRSAPIEPFENRLMNNSETSIFWNIIFEKAVRNSELKLKPAPYRSISTDYFKIRDCFEETNKSEDLEQSYSLIKEYIPDYLDVNFENNYYISLMRGTPKGKILKQVSFSRPRGTTFINELNDTATTQDVYGELDVKDFHFRFIYNRNSKTHEFNKRSGQIMSLNGQDWYPIDTVCYRIPTDHNPLTIDSSDSFGWLTMNDISQGYYEIYLKSASIDSLTLTIDFSGAVNFWPSVNPDVKTGTSITFSDPIKVLQIKKDGLRLFYESKELANKQSIRLFAVTAVISGLLIILITFIILALYRASKSIRGRYKQL